jgi:uncharacterized protein YlxW (UPF0749 family)
MHLKKGYLSIAIVSIVLGIMLAVQFKVTQDSLEALPLQRAEDLTIELKAVQKEATSAGTISYTDMENELSKIREIAGLVAVRGPGVVVTLDDSKRALKPGEDPNLYLIHDEDILKVVNELKASEAEAISVNGQRIVAMSEIRCAGPNILVNEKKVAPPFQILAVGDPDTLEGSLKLKGGIIETLQYWGIEVKVEKSQNLKIPAYKGSTKFNYAVAEGSGE